MRVLVVNSHHYRRGGDSAQFLDHVAALEGRGHDVAVFCMRHPDNLPSVWSEYWAPHVEYRGVLSVRDRVHAAWRGIHSAEAARGMKRLLRDFRPDVVHFHSVQHHLTLAVVDACLSAHLPTVWTLHDYRAVCPASALLRNGELCERCAGGRYWHCVSGRCKSGELSRSAAGAAESYLTQMRGALSKIDCYVAPSRFLGSKVLDMGLRARRMEIVPNPAPAAASALAGADRSGLLYVGRLSPEKGVDVLIRALAGCSDVRLRVVGDGPEEQLLRELARQVKANVAFDGWASSAAVREHMAAAGLLCVPSVWYENCPGVVLEAMSAGLPVVGGVRSGAVPWVLDDGDAGVLVDVKQPSEIARGISGLLDDENEAQAIIARARDRVAKHFSPRVVCEAYLAEYDRLRRERR